MTKPWAPLKRLMQLDPSDAWVWYYRSFILAKQERYKEAAEAAGTFLESEPDHADIWVIKGIAQYRIGKFADAVIALDQAILQNPLVADAWLYKGFSLFELERYEAAAYALDKAAEMNPEQHDLLFPARPTRRWAVSARRWRILTGQLLQNRIISMRCTAGVYPAST